MMGKNIPGVNVKDYRVLSSGPAEQAPSRWPDIIIVFREATVEKP